MNRTLGPIAATLALSAVACLPLTGCHVHTDKNSNGDNVDIGTPFGSMQVKTNDKADTAALGLTAYPGAVPVKENDKDSSNADINMSFGGFHLGVKAAAFQTPDQQEKVLAFYRKDLGRYGDVIECKGSSTIGQPTHTAQGLTCDTSRGNHVSTGSLDGSSVELRAGSAQHQHIVGVEPKDGCTKIGLVALDLPSHLSGHGKNDIE
jgi:hypothetical protein